MKAHEQVACAKQLLELVNDGATRLNRGIKQTNDVIAKLEANQKKDFDYLEMMRLKRGIPARKGVKGMT